MCEGWRDQREGRNDVSVVSKIKEIITHMHTHRNLQRLQLYAQGPCILKPETITVWSGASEHKILFYPEELMTCESCWQREPQFSLRVLPLVYQLPTRVSPTLESSCWSVQTALERKKGVGLGREREFIKLAK